MFIKMNWRPFFIASVLALGLWSVIGNVVLGTVLYIQATEITALKNERENVIKTLNTCVESNKVLQARIDNALLPQATVAEVINDGWINTKQAVSNSYQFVTDNIKSGWNSLFDTSDVNVGQAK
jgi:hypothetical protein